MLALDPVTEDILQCWIRNEKEIMMHSKLDSAVSWKTTYFLTLQSYYVLRLVSYTLFIIPSNYLQTLCFRDSVTVLGDGKEGKASFPELMRLDNIVIHHFHVYKH